MTRAISQRIPSSQYGPFSGPGIPFKYVEHAHGGFCMSEYGGALGELRIGTEKTEAS